MTTSTKASGWTRHRTLGARGPATSALGVGTWALGGPCTFDGRDAGWGDVDDAESVKALRTAIDSGVRLVDTAPCYGAGHAEEVVGRALAALPPRVRDEVTVATKFGLRIDEATRSGAGTDVTPEAIRAECDASLRRLGVESIDVYQLHGGAETTAQAEDAVATCEELRSAGKIRFIGTAQDDQAIGVFARSKHTVSVQTQANVFGWSASVVDEARDFGLAVLARSPLAMGLLSGKYDMSHRPAPGDVRLDTPWWTYFDEDAMPQWLARLETVRELLTNDGRTLIQGALGYLWAMEPSMTPLPGVRTVDQATENAEALALGPIAEDVAGQITALLSDPAPRG